MTAIAAFAFILSAVFQPQSQPPEALQATLDQTLPFAGLVVDQADILDLPAEARITERLHRLRQASAHQFVVVTVRSLGGADVKAFTLRLANRWGVGRRGVNDGIVLLVAPKERKVQIVIGSGLQTTLSDARCTEILDRIVVPHFRRGDFAGGIEAGVGAVIATLRRAEHWRVGAARP